MKYILKDKKKKRISLRLNHCYMKYYIFSSHGLRWQAVLLLSACSGRFTLVSISLEADNNSLDQFDKIMKYVVRIVSNFEEINPTKKESVFSLQINSNTAPEFV